MNLEKIYPSTDTGKDSILKLERNQKIISTQTNNNTNQINVLNDDLINYDRCYYTLEKLGLEDSQFIGLSRQEAFDLILSKFTITSQLHAKIKIRLTLAYSNFRVALTGSVDTACIDIEIFSHGRYFATYTSEEKSPCASKICTGYEGFNSGWSIITTEEEIETLNSRLTDLETQIIQLQNN